MGAQSGVEGGILSRAHHIVILHGFGDVSLVDAECEGFLH